MITQIDCIRITRVKRIKTVIVYLLVLWTFCVLLADKFNVPGLNYTGAIKYINGGK